MIYISWANSRNISGDTISGFSTLIATSWLQYVPRKLSTRQEQEIIRLTTQKRKVTGNYHSSELTDRRKTLIQVCYQM